MSYFLKQTKNKKGTYLQVYESTYDAQKGYGTHRSVRPIGYVHELEEQGVEDPVSHYKAEVASMNEAARAAKRASRARKIGQESPERFMGHFAVGALFDGLGVARDLAYLQMPSGFRFSLAELLRALVCARVVAPASKSKTFHDVLPLLGEAPSFSLDQLYEGLSYLGHEYKKVIEIFNERVGAAFGRDTARTYFDCTNFYFEIDREDDLRRKGPSKERKVEPIVGMGLLLDADCIPIGMEIYPGNESERPKMRKVVGELKRRHHIQGRTVQVADKGLNCAENVVDATLAGDGYLFSKSVKALPKAELSWVLAEAGWEDHLDANGKVHHMTKSVVGEFAYHVTGEDGKKKEVSLPEKRVVTFNPSLQAKQLHEINRQVEKARNLRLAGAKKSAYGDASKYVTFAAVDREGELKDDEVVVATLNHEAIKRAKSLAGYNMLVTSEASMGDDEIYATYHQLWRIEESFRVMKSELDARPVFLQRHDSIAGHFLICYLAVVLLRLLQIKVLKDEFGSRQLVECMRSLRAVSFSERKYVNVSKASPVIDRLVELTGLPLDNYYLNKGEFDKIVGYKFSNLKTL